MLSLAATPRSLSAALCASVALCATATFATPARADTIRAGQQWVLDMMDVAPAWQVSQGAGVTVAVIDSGVDGTVSDLSQQVTQGPDFTGVATKPSNPNWGVHGTWMASLIAGHGHDDGASGVIGIAPEARLMSIRVIPDRADPRYSRYEHEPETQIQQSLADGIDYAVSNGAQVLSMSIGYSAPSTQVRKALLNAFNHGVVVVASAGNSGSSSSTGHGGQSPESFPADYPGVISVGAVNSGGQVAGFSSDNLSVQVAAPGVNVPAQGRDGQYWYVSGTSPACALVAGVAALVKSRYPDLAPDLVAKALTSTTTGRPKGKYDSQIGFGIVDATAAMARAATLASAGHATKGGETVGTEHVTIVPTGVPVGAHFGGGPAAIPPEPVRPRSSGPLVVFVVLGVTCFVLTAAAATRLTLLSRNTDD
jgi:subtilisin family serine protease